MIATRATLAGALLALAAWAHAQALYNVPPPPRATVSSPHSVLFDTQAAARERSRQAPSYIESIIVEGRDPDAPRRAKPVEQRFADALLAPPKAASAGLKPLDTTPCMSVPSTWNNLGNSYAPITGCP